MAMPPAPGQSTAGFCKLPFPQTFYAVATPDGLGNGRCGKFKLESRTHVKRQRMHACTRSAVLVEPFRQNAGNATLLYSCMKLGSSHAEKQSPRVTPAIATCLSGCRAGLTLFVTPL